MLVAGSLYFKYGKIPAVHAALQGCAAGAIGLTLANALELTQEQFAWRLGIAFIAVTAVAVSWFKVPLVIER